jgi:hypothetical protein
MRHTGQEARASAIRSLRARTPTHTLTLLSVRCGDGERPISLSSFTPYPKITKDNKPHLMGIVMAGWAGRTHKTNCLREQELCS